MIDEIIKYCGEYPEVYKEINITNSPDFVFENDPDYSPISLFDSEGNTVIVNSFVECEHYVGGGWNYDLIAKEFLNYTNLSLILLIILGIHFSYNKLLKKF